jgi:hypothetical protein
MTDTDLARQLAAYVDATTAPVANPADRRNGHSARQIPTEIGTIMLTEERIEETPTHRPVRWLMLAAAAVAAIVVGFVITSSGSDEGPAPADQPTPTPAATSPDEDATDDTPTDSVSPAAAALALVGDELMMALAAGDATAATELISTDATLEFHTAQRADQLAALFGWLAASDYRFEWDACRGVEPGEVRCLGTQANTWTDVAGIDPVRVRMSLLVEDGTITRVVHMPDWRTWARAFGPFQRFVLDNHPEDVDTMWVVDESGDAGGPAFTDASNELFERYTDEYADAIADGS